MQESTTGAVIHSNDFITYSFCIECSNPIYMSWDGFWWHGHQGVDDCSLEDRDNEYIYYVCYGFPDNWKMIELHPYKGI